eukprot:GHVP01021606.1.p1 GENE.GHVP01021606.1~~GHVP01021606.1.p1  ORF type:complete len:468 (-),score=97.38 GHVP01021606.1:56-1417(-)
MDAAKKIQDEIFFASHEGNLIFQNCNFQEIDDPLFCANNNSKHSSRENKIASLKEKLRSNIKPIMTILIPAVAIGGLGLRWWMSKNKEISTPTVPKNGDKNTLSPDNKGPMDKSPAENAERSGPYGNEKMKNEATETPASKSQEIKGDLLPRSREKSTQPLSTRSQTSLLTTPKPVMLYDEDSADEEVPETPILKDRKLIESSDKGGTKGLLVFNDNSYYKGDLQGLQRHGRGIHFTPPKPPTEYWEAYEGQWKDDKKHGLGKDYQGGDGMQFDANSSYMEGTWKDGKLDVTKKKTWVSKGGNQVCEEYGNGMQKKNRKGGQIEVSQIEDSDEGSTFVEVNPNGDITTGKKRYEKKDNELQHSLVGDDVVTKKCNPDLKKEEIIRRKIGSEDYERTKTIGEKETLTLKSDSRVEYSADETSYTTDTDGSFIIDDGKTRKRYTNSGHIEVEENN